MDTDAFAKASKIWVPEYVVIKDDAEAMAIYQSLQKDVGKIKKLIRKKVSRPFNGGNVLNIIGFFATVKPNIAQELVEHLKDGDAENFVLLVNSNIIEALELRKMYLRIDGEGFTTNPGKKQIDDAIEILNKYVLLSTSPKGEVSWLSVTPVPVGLVPFEWMFLDKKIGFSLLMRFLDFIIGKR